MVTQSKIECFINVTKKYFIYNFATAYKFIKVTIPGTLCITLSNFILLLIFLSLIRLMLMLKNEGKFSLFIKWTKQVQKSKIDFFQNHWKYLNFWNLNRYFAWIIFYWLWPHCTVWRSLGVLPCLALRSWGVRLWPSST